MKSVLPVALVVLALTPGAASSQMMGGGMGEDKKPGGMMGQCKEMMGGGMGEDKMPGGMMGGQCKEMMGGGMMPTGMSGGMMPGMMPGGMMPGGMMPGGMMGAETMGAAMPSMMDAMMPGKTRGCMMMAEGMMKGQMDMAQMRKTLALSDGQPEKLRDGLRPLQKEAILTLASLKVAELELGDILAGAQMDFGKIEAKLKEIEAMRTKVRLAHLKAAEAVKGVLSEEQLEKLQEAVEGFPSPAPAVLVSPQKGAAPPAAAGHEKHH